MGIAPPALRTQPLRWRFNAHAVEAIAAMLAGKEASSAWAAISPSHPGQSAHPPPWRHAT